MWVNQGLKSDMIEAPSDWKWETCCSSVMSGLTKSRNGTSLTVLLRRENEKNIETRPNCRENGWKGTEMRNQFFIRMTLGLIRGKFQLRKSQIGARGDGIIATPLRSANGPRGGAGVPWGSVMVTDSEWPYCGWRLGHYYDVFLVGKKKNINSRVSAKYRLCLPGACSQAAKFCRPTKKLPICGKITLKYSG